MHTTDTSPVRVAAIPAAAAATSVATDTVRAKKPTRLRRLAVILTLGALPLAGCGIQEGAETSRYYPQTHYTFEQQLPDGGTVLCVWAKSGYGGGLSCDWAGVAR